MFYLHLAIDKKNWLFLLYLKLCIMKEVESVNVLYSNCFVLLYLNSPSSKYLNILNMKGKY